MRICDTITIRRGRAYEIKSISEDGTMLLRPTKAVALRLEPKRIERTEVAVSDEIETPCEPVTITHARREMVSISTRYGSCAHEGSRKHAAVKNGTLFMFKRMKGWKQSGSDSWKNHRNAQYRSKEMMQ